MKRSLLVTLFLLIAVPAATFSGEPLLPHLTQGNLFSPAVVPTACVVRDSTDLYWAFFSSDFFGFHEFWVAYSRDTHNWSRPIYTAIPSRPSSNIQLQVGKHHIDIDWRHIGEPPAGRHYHRAFIDTTHTGYTIFKETLYEDSDADGLNNLSEDVLWTDPLDTDTDDDDKVDGYDMNPLAAPADTLSLHEELHKAIIEYELEEFYSNQLVVVEQFNNLPMEYNRYEGLVLSLSPGACDAYVGATGYGVPILTCTVSDAGNQQLKASFQFFKAPDDAWGYDVLCRWSKTANDFVDFRIINEWVAQ